MLRSKEEAGEQSRIGRLLANLWYFAAGGLITRLIAIGLIPFYARSLGPSGYGEIELITSTTGLLFPLVSLSLYEGVLRFVMNKALDKQEVMTNVIIMLVLGLLFGSIIFYYFSDALPGIAAYAGLIVVLIILQTILSIVGQFTRADGDVRGFVLAGILEAVTVAVVAIVALYVLDMGVVGYIIGLGSGHITGILFLSFRSRIWWVFDLRKLSWKMSRALLRFCFPLMINGALWWIVNSVNRLFIAEYSGLAEVGLFGVAQKVSSLLAAALIIFNEAWQMSANEEYSTRSFKDYVSSVFNGFHLIVLAACVMVIGVAVPLIVPIFGPDYVSAIPLIPLMVLSALLSGSASFVGALHMANMKTGSIMLSSLAAGITVFVGNLLLVPKYNAMGAAVAAVVGFGVLLVWRLFSARDTVSISAMAKMGLSLVVIMVACVPALFDVEVLLISLAQLAALLVLPIIYWKDLRHTLRLVDDRRLKG